MDLKRNRKKLPVAVLQEIEGWVNHPELKKLVLRLDESSDDHFLDTYAEILIASKLLEHKCYLYYEVPTSGRKSADFKAVRDGLNFFVHVKRLATDEATQKQFNISKRALVTLEKIVRPLVVSLSFTRDLCDEEMQQFVKEAARFLKKASVGQHISIEGKNRVELGECLIVSESCGQCVTLMVRYASSSADARLRLCDRLSDAYKQFQANAVNVILVNGDWLGDVDEFENALLGTSHTALLADGGVKMERKVDGFWSQAKHPDSNLAGWFNFLPSREGISSRCWTRSRETLNPAIHDLLVEIFNPTCCSP